MSWFKSQHLSWFACLLCLSTLSSSKALQSISIGILAAGALWQLWERRSLAVWKQNRYAWWLGGILLLTLLSYFLTSDLAQWSRDVKGKLLFVAIPLALGGMMGFSAKQYRLLWYGFILSQTIVAALSLSRYFASYEVINEQIGRNANIDIVGNMSHIYFGLLLSISIILGLYLSWRFSPVWSKTERWFIGLITLLNIVFLHILTSRTGLLTFYVGLGTIALWFLLSQRKKWPVFVLGAVFILGPVLSYQFIPSFRQRVEVTIWDLQQYQPDSQIAADYSLASRIFAWQTAGQIFRDHPWTGIGIGDIEAVMVARAPEQIPLGKRLRNPHNQYLEYAAAFGVWGLLWLFGLLGLPLRQRDFMRAWLALAFLAMYATGMVFESLLERQVGICLFCFFVYLLADFQHIEAQTD